MVNVLNTATGGSRDPTRLRTTTCQRSKWEVTNHSWAVPARNSHTAAHTDSHTTYSSGGHNGFVEHQVQATSDYGQMAAC